MIPRIINILYNISRINAIAGFFQCILSYYILLYLTFQYLLRKSYIIGIREAKAGIKMKPLKEKISITIDMDILEKLRVMAEEDDRSLSQYINIVLKEHVNKTNTDKQE